MKTEKFRELLAGNNGIKITQDLVIYNDFELYNYKTGESKCYNSLEELVNANPNVKKIIEEAEDFYFDWNKEGATSSNQEMGGGKHSVSFFDTEKDGTMIHNHPSGSNFSDTDLHSFANSQLKSVVATSSSATTKGRYQITKTSHFKAKEFDKAVSKAKWPAHMDYNTGASWWLKKNAKTYGYIFTQKGVKIGDEWKK